MLRRLPASPHVVQFFDGAILSFEGRDTRLAVLLFELCSEGSLLDFVMKRKDCPLEEPLVLGILSQIVR